MITFESTAQHSSVLLVVRHYDNASYLERYWPIKSVNNKKVSSVGTIERTLVGAR